MYVLPTACNSVPGSVTTEQFLLPVMASHISDRIGRVSEIAIGALVQSQSVPGDHFAYLE